MSVHRVIVETPEETYIVQIGWDVPLQHFYMNIFSGDVQSDQYVEYSSLEDHNISLGSVKKLDSFIRIFNMYFTAPFPVDTYHLLNEDMLYRESKLYDDVIIQSEVIIVKF